jgi:sulfatase modifying factor 1
MKWSDFTGDVLHSRSLFAFIVMAIPIVASCRSQETQSADAEPPRATPEVAPSNSAVAANENALRDASFDASAEDAGDAAADAEMSFESRDAAFDAAEIDASVAPPEPCPPEMAHIGRYCVDRYEGHLVTKNDDGTTMLWPHYDRPENATFFAQSAAGVFPQAYISRVEAKKACGNSGKRLCSRSEWMRACKGSRGTRYPYGNDGKRGACNTGKGHLLHTFFGAKRGGWSYENFNDPKLNQEPGFLGKSGEYEKCHSDEEVFDIVGNLHEWINDDVGTDIEQVLEKDGVERKEQPWRAGNAMFMGGFFSTTVEHGPGCTYTTIAHEPTYHDYSTGFRCCKTATLPDKPSKNKTKSKK